MEIVTDNRVKRKCAPRGSTRSKSSKGNCDTPTSVTPLGVTPPNSLHNFLMVHLADFPLTGKTLANERLRELGSRHRRGLAKQCVNGVKVLLAYHRADPTHGAALDIHAGQSLQQSFGAFRRHGRRV